MENFSCPCGSEKSYQQCCEPLHKGSAQAETAEQLMRSRYTAFVVNNLDYILETHDPSSREEVDMEGNRRWAKSSQWKGLKINKTKSGEKGDDWGEVDFTATYEADGKVQAHHELSEFKKVKGAWFYVDGKNVGVETFVREEPKVGRNDPCHCGSGKKFKKCHGAG